MVLPVIFTVLFIVFWSIFILAVWKDDREVGTGSLLFALMFGALAIVATAYCGENYWGGLPLRQSQLTEDGIYERITIDQHVTLKDMSGKFRAYQVHDELDNDARFYQVKNGKLLPFSTVPQKVED